MCPRSHGSFNAVRQMLHLTITHPTPSTPNTHRDIETEARSEQQLLSRVEPGGGCVLPHPCPACAHRRHDHLLQSLYSLKVGLVGCNDFHKRSESLAPGSLNTWHVYQRSLISRTRKMMLPSVLHGAPKPRDWSLVLGVTLRGSQINRGTFIGM